jgi:hypothetical protein
MNGEPGYEFENGMRFRNNENKYFLNEKEALNKAEEIQKEFIKQYS